MLRQFFSGFRRKHLFVTTCIEIHWTGPLIDTRESKITLKELSVVSITVVNKVHVNWPESKCKKNLFLYGLHVKYAVQLGSVELEFLTKLK